MLYYSKTNDTMYNYYSAIRARLFKITMSLVNVLLEFQTLTSVIIQYFLLKNCVKLLHSLIFSTKNVSVFGYTVIKHLTS